MYLRISQNRVLMFLVLNITMNKTISSANDVNLRRSLPLHRILVVVFLCGTLTACSSEDVTVVAVEQPYNAANEAAFWTPSIASLQQEAPTASSGTLAHTVSTNDYVVEFVSNRMSPTQWGPTGRVTHAPGSYDDTRQQ